MSTEKETRRRIIALLVIAALIAAIIALLWMDRQRAKERAALYEQNVSQSSKERSESKKQGKEALEYLQKEIGNADLVVWGDRLAAGNITDRSAAESLQELVNEKLIDPIASELVSDGVLSRPSTLWIRVWNMGVINEGMGEIMARAGVKKVVTGNEITLPEIADDKYIDLDIEDENGERQYFAKQRSAEIGVVTIQGVEGHLYDGSEKYDAAHSRLAFSRDKSGEEMTIPKGSEIYFESAVKYRECLPILMFEDNGESGFDADHIDNLKSILEQHYTVRSYDNEEAVYVVVCATEAGSEADEELEETFGEHYLRVEPQIDELSRAEYDELAGRIYDCLDEQGSFSEVKSAVERAEEMLEKVN